MRHVQHELGLEVEILRVRREARLQEVLREDARGAKEALENFSREHDEEKRALSSQRVQ